MNRNEFNRFVAGIDLPGPGDLEGLRELTALFPWFHSAHLVLLKGLRANSDIRFDSQLKASALSVSDREVLYHYLFLSPVEAAGEPENLVREEEVETEPAPAEEVTAPDAETAIAEEEVSAEMEEVTAPEEVVVSPVPEETASAEEVTAPAAEATIAEEEEVAVVEEEEIAVAEEEEVAVVEEEEIAVAEEETAAPAEEEVALMPEETEDIISPEGAGEIPPPEEDEEMLTSEKTGEILSPEEEEGILSPEEAVEISTPLEAEGMVAPGETEIRDEGQAEELPAPVLSEAEADAKTEPRTREELIAEIEARLRELESYRQVIVKEQDPVIVDEMVAAVESEPEPAPEHVPSPEPEIEEPLAPEPEPEIEEPLAPEPEPEIEEPLTPEPEPEIEEPLAPEPKPEIEESPASESGVLLELIPDTVAEVETPEEKLSAADLIDRFIMISPTMERMSPKDYQPVRDVTEQGSDEPGKFITETLAKIYINQGYYTRAINIYEKLALQYPEKSTYFASRIEKIKDLIK